MTAKAERQTVPDSRVSLQPEMVDWYALKRAAEDWAATRGHSIGRGNGGARFTWGQF
jgi:hypothetical protein